MAIQSVILEPLSTGDIIDRSVRLYRQNLRPLLATVAVPFVVGAVGWLVMEIGKNSFQIDDPDAGAPIKALVLIFAGLGISIVYFYLMVLAVGGLSRTVGDHIMLGEPMSMRASLRAIRSRIGALSVASVLLGVALMAIMFFSTMIFFLAVMISGLVAAALSVLQLPAEVTGVIFAVVFIVAIGVVVFGVLPLLLSRVVFIPQAVMIEGCSAGMAMTRAMTLGADNWYRVLGILLFSYFVSWSLAAAVLAPITLLLWLSGYLSLDIDTINAVTGGINQFSWFLVVPVWSISYTLLYFDSRVRKEGYDVDLLARRLPPPPPPRAAAAPAMAMPGVDGAPMFARAKFAADGRCMRCGRYNLFNSPNCPGCGW